MKTGLGGASGGQPLHAIESGVGLIGTWTPTRNVAGDYYMALTAAANSPFFIFNIPYGVLLKSFDVIFSIGTAALTTFTAGLYQTQYVTGQAAGTVTTKLAPVSLGTASTTNNIAVVNVPVPAPYFAGVHENAALIDGLPDTLDYVELAIVNPGTAVLRLYAVMLYGNREI